MAAIRIIDSHLELADVGANDHHNELHTIVSHSDTSATGAQLDTLTDNSIANALHRHSELVASDGLPDPALSVDAAGKVGIGTPTPGYLLHLVSAVDTRIKVAVTTAGQGCGFDFENTADSHAWRVTGQATQFKIRDHTNTLDKFVIKTGATGDVYFNNIRNFGIGIATPATSAKLEIASTTGALLLTRMTTAQKNALTAVNGMLLYDSTLNKFQGYENGSWTNLI